MNDTNNIDNDLAVDDLKLITNTTLAKHFGKPVVTKRTDIEIRVYKGDRELTKATEKEGS